MPPTGTDLKSSLKPDLLAGPVPDCEALIDVCIGQPWLDWMKGEHLDLRNEGTPSSSLKTST